MIAAGGSLSPSAGRSTLHADAQAIWRAATARGPLLRCGSGIGDLHAERGAVRLAVRGRGLAAAEPGAAARGADLTPACRWEPRTCCSRTSRRNGGIKCGLAISPPSPLTKAGCIVSVSPPAKLHSTHRTQPSAAAPTPPRGQIWLALTGACQSVLVRCYDLYAAAFHWAKPFQISAIISP